VEQLRKLIEAKRSVGESQMSLREIEVETGIHYTSLWRMMKGYKPSVDNLEKVSRWLNVSIDSILEGGFRGRNNS
jgi:hypothetical protein